MTRPNEKLVAIDVGNSRIKFALFQTTDERSLPNCQDFIAVPLGTAAPWSALERWGVGRGLSVVAAASNAPALEAFQLDWSGQRLCPLGVVRSRGRLPIRIDVEEPERVGLDRVLNAIAARRVCDRAESAIIVDSGTATTIDIVDAEGVFRGGAILPGFEMGARALHDYTAALPQIALRELAGPPGSTGRNTTAAMRSGLYWGHVGAVRELIVRQCQERGWRVPSCVLPAAADASGETATGPKLILTGGAAPVLGWAFSPAVQIASLAMAGLVIAVTVAPECIE